MKMELSISTLTRRLVVGLRQLREDGAIGYLMTANLHLTAFEKGDCGGYYLATVRAAYCESVNDEYLTGEGGLNG